MDLRELTAPLGAERISAIITGRAPDPDSRSLGIEVDLDPVFAAIEAHPAERGAEGLEAATAPILHVQLKHLPRRTMLNPGLWNWMAIGPFREFVVRRWHGGRVPADAIQASELIRWELRPSLRGYANHAVARLYWCAAHLNREGDYSLVGDVLSKQDLFKNIFERELCLHPPAARACVQTLKGSRESEWRERIKHLNFVLSTIAVEFLDEADIAELLRSS